MDQKIKNAVDVLKKDGIVIYPTDTAFGIGCRIDEEKAVKRLFRIRKRPENQPTPVLVDSIEMAQKYLQPIPDEVRSKLIDKYWPGALTIILSCKIDKVPNFVRGGGVTIGVRIPDHSITREIIKSVGVPILGPSANFHREKTPYRFEDLDKNLVELVDYVVPGECLLKQQSTVIDCSKKPWRVIRQGAIKIQNSKVKNNRLFIDTSSNKEIKVGIETEGKRYELSQKINTQKAQIALSLIVKLLKQQRLSLDDIMLIEINTLGGSFTGIRVGMAIANALSFTRKIPIKKIK